MQSSKGILFTVPSYGALLYCVVTDAEVGKAIAHTQTVWIMNWLNYLITSTINV
jgi:hypothetical protein